MAEHVSFSFRNRKNIRSVHLVGTFNDWNRVSHPLSFDQTTHNWVIDAEIEPGEHRYLFVVNGQKWVTDPNAKRVKDMNGNPNSVLLVLPHGFEEAPARRGDGIITLEALQHSSTVGDVVRRSDREWLFHVHTRANDVQTVRIQAQDDLGNRYSVKLHRLEGNALNERWRAKLLLKAGARRLEYRFEVSDGPNAPRAFLGKFEILVSDFPLPDVPAWLEGTVFYQIFPDRFADGDVASNAPDAPEWSSSPIQKRFFGGDLQGIVEHWDHLESLGVNGIYLNPMFDCQSYHGYDIKDYLEVDPRFGGAAGWAALKSQAESSGMKLMLDAVFNHCGSESPLFQEVVQNGANAKHKDWFFDLKFPVKVGANPPTYRSWAGVPHMPKLNQDNPETREYFLEVGRHWIRDGIHAWRLDVANEVSQEFWRAFRSAAREQDPQAYILGEHWSDATAWLQGDQWDSVMNYRFREAVILFCQGKLNCKKFVKMILRFIEDHPEVTQHAMFNILGSHDTPRFRTLVPDRQAEQLAYALLFFYPGVPCVFYGDEVGIEGGHDPDCRKTMDWSEKSWDRKQFELLQKLIQLKKTHPALRKGGFDGHIERGANQVIQLYRKVGESTLCMTINQSSEPVPNVRGTQLIGNSNSKSQVEPGCFSWVEPE